MSGGGAATIANDDGVAVGGEDAKQTRIIDQLVFYKVGTGWSANQHMVAPRHGFELAVFQGRAWACVGGSVPGLHPVATCTSLGDGPSALANG